MRVNRIVLMTVLLLLSTSIASAKSYEVKKKVDGYNVVKGKKHWITNFTVDVE